MPSDGANSSANRLRKSGISSTRSRRALEARIAGGTRRGDKAQVFAERVRGRPSRSDHALVAAMMRTSAMREAGELPTGSYWRSCSTRRILACRFNGMSPTSSRKSVPPSAWAKRPRRLLSAPVKLPFTWPKNSLSSSAPGMAAAQLTATKGRRWRGLLEVNGAGHHLLARTAFAGEQHGCALFAHFTDRAQHLLERGGLAHQRVEFVAPRQFLAQAFIVAQRLMMAQAVGESPGRSTCRCIRKRHP